jgi:hypothetical protein
MEGTKRAHICLSWSELARALGLQGYPIKVYSEQDNDYLHIMLESDDPDLTWEDDGFLSFSPGQYIEAKSLDQVVKEADESSLELAFRLAEEMAGEVADGHLTLMRFTTGWKAIYGTPNDEDRDYIWSLRNNTTAAAALDDLVSRPPRRDR